MSFIHKLHYISIRLRLVIMMVALTLVIIVSHAAITILNDVNLVRKQLIHETTIANRVLEQDFIRVLLTDDANIAADITSKLKSFPMILHTDLLNENGDILLHFSRDNKESHLGEIIIDKDGLFINDRLFMSLPIILHSKKIGMLHYAISTDKINKRLQEIYKIILITSLGGILFAIIGALFLQRFFTHPLIKLTKKTQQITQANDYSYRIKEDQWNKSEYGVLQRSFNNMLSTIELANQTITEQKERLEVTLNSIGDAVIVMDINSTITSMNPIAVNMTGWTVEQAQGKKLTEVFNIIDARSREKIANPVETVLKTGKVVELDEHTTLLSRNGNEYQIMDSVAPIKNKERNLIGFIIVFHDITSQYEDRRLIEQSEERLRLAMDVSSDGVWDWNIKTGEILFSDKWCRSLGFERNDIEGTFTSIKSLLHPDDQNSDYLLEDHLEGKTDTYIHENRLRMKSGEYRFNLTQGRVFEWDAEGKPVRMIGTDTNMNKRKKVEDEYRKLSRAVMSSSSAIFITDLKGIIEYVNPSFTKITGYTKTDVLGKTPQILKSGKTPEKTFADLWKTILLGKEWKGELNNRKANGKFYWARTAISGVSNERGTLTHFVAIQDDVTHEYELSEQLKYQASYDPLTGLINRREFEHRVDRAILTTHQNQTKHALCFMDLDRFKIVNDSCGHPAGDELLRQLAKLLENQVRKRDTLARLGGDEFAILMEHCTLEQAKRVANAVLDAVQQFIFNWDGAGFRIGISIGLVEINETISDVTELQKLADAACYMAKAQGRNRVHLYHPDDRELAQRDGELQWMTRIYKALDENLFCLYAQEILPIKGQAGKHYEVLLRLIDQNGKHIPPGAFLPSAERYNLMIKIDRWVIEQSFSLLVDHPQFLEADDFVSINLSGQSLTDEAFLDFLIKQFQESGVDGHKICFEITETTAISNLNKANQLIACLKQFGCSFALDDFGSGLSSYAYLKQLCVDYLKIDGMFVKDIVDDPINHAMVKSINEIGQIMNMQTIAEFVENDSIKELLIEIGVDYAQGYGIDKPRPFIDILKE